MFFGRRKTRRKKHLLYTLLRTPLNARLSNGSGATKPDLKLTFSCEATMTAFSFPVESLQPAEWLSLGLDIAGFSLARQQRCDHTHMQRFKEHFGVRPETLNSIFVDLQMTNIRAASISETKRHLSCFLWHSFGSRITRQNWSWRECSRSMKRLLFTTFGSTPKLFKPSKPSRWAFFISMSSVGRFASSIELPPQYIYRHTNRQNRYFCPLI